MMKIINRSYLSCLAFWFFILFIGCKTNVTSDASMVLDSYKNQGWEVIDSIEVSLSDDSIEGFAVVLKNEQLDKGRLLLYHKNSSNNYMLSCDNSSFFNESETGQSGLQAYSGIKQTKDGIAISFESGGTTILLQTFYFEFIENYLILTKYSTEEYDVLNVNSEGEINAIFTEEFNLQQGVKIVYKLENSERHNVKQYSFASKKIKINNLIAMEGFDK